MSGPTLSDVQRDLRRRKSDLIRDAHETIVANEPIPTETLEKIEGIAKIEAIVDGKRRLRRQLIDLFALGLAALILAALFLIRLPRAAVDVELQATGLQFELGLGASANLIPGEAGQILALNKATVTGIEEALPADAADGGYLELRAEAPDETGGAQRRVDPAVRLFAIALPPESSTSISTKVAYSGNSRGVSIGIRSAKATEAAFGRLVLAPPTVGKGPPQSAVEQISIAGKHLEFALYSNDETRDLAIFRNTRVTRVSFDQSGSSEILGGQVHVRGRNEKSPVVLRPSDILLLRSAKPMVLRELSLSGGQLRAILSVPEADEVRLGGIVSRDLRPTLLQWLFYRWPNEPYVALTALIALWFSVRRWWDGSK